jgi:hypothetical protein
VGIPFMPYWYPQPPPRPWQPHYPATTTNKITLKLTNHGWFEGQARIKSDKVSQDDAERCTDVQTGVGGGETSKEVTMPVNADFTIGSPWGPPSAFPLG